MRKLTPWRAWRDDPTCCIFLNTTMTGQSRVVCTGLCVRLGAVLLRHRNTRASVPPDRLAITSVSWDQRAALFSCSDTKLSCEPRCWNPDTHKLLDSSDPGKKAPHLSGSTGVIGLGSEFNVVLKGFQYTEGNTGVVYAGHHLELPPFAACLCHSW